MLVTVFSRPFEIPGQQVAAPDDESDREEACKSNKRERPKDLYDKKQSGGDQHHADDRRAFYQRSLESFFVNGWTLAARNQHRGAISIDDGKDVKSHTGKRKNPGSYLEARELEQPNHGHKVDHRLDVLTVVYGAHPGKYGKQRRQPRLSSRACLVVAS